MDLPADKGTPAWLRTLGAAALLAFLAHGAVALRAANVARRQLALLGGEGTRFFAEAELGALLADQQSLVSWDRAAVVLTALTFVPLFVLLYRGLPNAKRPARWALFAWLIPIANLYLPFRLGAEIDRDARGWPSERRASWTIFVWWSAWLVGRLGGLLAGLAARQGELKNAARIDMASAGASFIASMAAVLMLRTWVFTRGRRA